MNLNEIPNELKVLTQFVGHRAKVPIDLKTGRAASSTNPTTWCNYYFAVANFQRLGCDGIGFVFKYPYLGVDLDDCIVDGQMNDFAKGVIEKLASYTEISPSGTGIHIICKGSIPRSVKTETYEVYNSARFFTLTGNVVQPTRPVRLLTTELQDLGLVTSGNETDTSNKQGWIKESLEALKPGNLHNESIRIIGRLHEDGWEKGDIFTLLKPHIEKVGGDTQALLTRCESVARYPRAEEAIREAAQQLYAEDEFDAEQAVENIEKVEWLVPGLIAKQSIGILAGLQGTKKTWIALDLATELARGGYWLGKFPVPESKVYYIEQERSRAETQRRLLALWNGKSINPKSLKETFQIKFHGKREIKINLEADFHYLKSRIEKLRPDVVIIDSFSTFHTLNELVKQDMMVIADKLKALREEYKCAFLFLDHEVKSTFTDSLTGVPPSATRVSGSQAKIAVPEVILTVRKEGDASYIYHTKGTQSEESQPIMVRVEDVTADKTKISVRAY